MNVILQINPKFEQIIPPLTAEEFAQLEENILKLGRVTDPIQVWLGFIVDGHHRYKIVQKHPEIAFSTYEMDFSCDAEAIAWICSLQLGRRNISDIHRDYLIGKRYAAEKEFRGGDRKSAKAKSSGQNDHLILGLKTRSRIAQESNVSESTVRRAEYLANGIDAAEEEHPGIREMIFSEKIKPTKNELCEISRLPKEKRKDAVELLFIPKDEREGKKIARQIEEECAHDAEKEEEIEEKCEKDIIAPQTPPIPDLHLASEPIPKQPEPPGCPSREIEESIIHSMYGTLNMFIESINDFLSRFPKLITEPKYREQTKELMAAAKKYIHDVEGELK